MIRYFSVFYLIALLSCLPAARAEDSATENKTPPKTSPESERHFTLKVLPLLKSKCFGCHDPKEGEMKGELDMTSRSSMLRGGESEEPTLIPGNSEDSPLMMAVRWEGMEMPPKENDRLTEQQIEDLDRWVQEGAPWPDEATQKRYRDAETRVRENEDGLLMDTSGGLSDEWTYRRYKREDLWAFEPLKDLDISSAKQPDENPVDHFIREKLSDARIEAAKQADPATLLRRAYLDLTGLPPTPEQSQVFLQAWENDSEAAWSELIEQLLASPHYGERWGQHWLDITRYADTGGYSNDYERSNAWRYRDYVIRSFNSDKPYNQFVIEQIAGDELADQSVRQRKGDDDQVVHETRLSGDYTPQETEWLIASGFLRMGPWDNAMVKDDEARQIYLDDVVNSVGQTFLATTMRCVKCHDHKFDPIPTRDYYRLYAAFSGTQMAERPAPLLESENTQGFQEGKAFVERMLKFATDEKNKLVEKREAAAREWFKEHDLEYVEHSKRKDLPDEMKPPRHYGLNHVEEGQLKVREQDEWIWTRRLERYQPMVQSVYNSADPKMTWNKARKLRINKTIDESVTPETTILMGGSLTAPGPEVGPGVLSAIRLPVMDSEGQSPNEKDPYLLPETLGGRRLALGRWIADERNSLAVRAIVNRIWQHHFNAAIARNPNNFGAKGSKPTHPELLDYLATDFIRNGWSMKYLHRLIMTSETYRQSTEHPEKSKIEEVDPDNRLLAYFSPRRLTAEEIRDGMLVVTGELNPMQGGLPASPEINMEVALQPRMIQFSIAPAYQPSRTPEQRNRRSIYAYRVRGMADPFLELFNQPNPNDSCEVRDSAAVTPQVFTLMNSDVMTDRSIAMAKRLQEEQQDLDQQIGSAFRLVLGRKATAEEQNRMLAYVHDMTQYHRDANPEKPTYPVEITRSLVEEFSGKVFEYQEILPTFENYVPDTKPADVDADTRALADFCLLLLNSNEFLYVY